ncbi:hypothetical protein NH340_JMT03975 [Sarcoptes scabiei]|nr:hypothetical protein NH340_JMT03975 [Sarcoptes scabiei]
MNINVVDTNDDDVDEGNKANLEPYEMDLNECNHHILPSLSSLTVSSEKLSKLISSVRIRTDSDWLNSTESTEWINKQEERIQERRIQSFSDRLNADVEDRSKQIQKRTSSTVQTKKLEPKNNKKDEKNSDGINNSRTKNTLTKNHQQNQNYQNSEQNHEKNGEGKNDSEGEKYLSLNNVNTLLQAGSSVKQFSDHESDFNGLLDGQVRLISMSSQPNEQIMNLYREWFKQNSYWALNSKNSRDKLSSFDFRRKELGPVIDPLNIRIKIISGQQLPRPKGATFKADSIDPYVVIQCLGLPIDCSEMRTATVSNDRNNPIFDESFEFNVYLPDLAMIRFLVLDDDYIEDDFIGQLTVPVTCLQPGYRHVRLMNLHDEVIPNASLFIQIALTNRFRFKHKLKRKKSWNQKNLVDLKQLGWRNLDDKIKSIFSLVHKSSLLRNSIEKYLIELCDECCLPESANIAQCLRIIVLRMTTCSSVTSLKIVKTESGYPSLKVDGELTAKLTRTMDLLDRILLELFLAIDQSKNHISFLAEMFKSISNFDYRYEMITNSNCDNLQAIVDDLLNKSSQTNRFDSKSISSSSTSSTSNPNLPNSVKCVVDKPEPSPNHHLHSPISKIFQLNPTVYHSNQEINRQTQSSASTVNVNSSTSTSVPTPNSTVSSSGSGKNLRRRTTDNRKIENLFVILSIIKNELDCLNKLQNDCRKTFDQIERIARSLERIFEREHKIVLRSNSYVYREISQIGQQNQLSLKTEDEDGIHYKRHSHLNLSDEKYRQTQSLLLSSTNETTHLRGILKKPSPSSVPPTPKNFE